VYCAGTNWDVGTSEIGYFKRVLGKYYHWAKGKDAFPREKHDALQRPFLFYKMLSPKRK